MDLSEVLERAVSESCHTCEQTGCSIDMRRPDHLPPVNGNAEQLTRVLLNLIENACRASLHTDGTIEVCAQYNTRAGRTQVSVEDHGCGIGPDELPRIFEPFFSTHRDRGGMGLGLSLSLQIVRAHGGDIHVESVLGTGSRFIVSLPVGGDAGYGRSIAV